MKNKILIFAIFFANLAHSQSDIKELFCVDTILRVNNLLLKDIHSSGIAFGINNENIVFNLSSDDKNNIPIGFYDKTKKVYNETILKVPDSILIDERNNIVSIKKTNRYVIVFFTKYYITFNFSLEKLESSFRSITHFDKDFGQYYVKNDSLLFCYKSYNSFSGAKVYISKYKLFENTPIKHIEPNFDCIALSHFSPNHWIDVNDNYIALTQACDYKVTIYNHDLEPIKTINREITEWKRLNKDTIDIYNNKRPMQILKDLNFTNSHRISKVEGVWWLNEKTLLIRYYLSEDANLPLSPRYFDVYTFENNTYKLTYSKVIDGGVRLAVNETSTKCNHYLLSWTNECFISKNNYIIMKPTVAIDYFNRNLGDVLNEQSQVMKTKPPYTGIWIYKWNDEKNK